MSTLTRQFGAQTYLDLKAKFRDLTALCGGITRCVGLTRSTQSRLSEACSPQHDDRFPALDQIMDLEADAGSPVVTRYLANLAGYDLQPIVANARPKTLYNEFADLTLKMADVQSSFASAMADGELSQNEAETLIKSADKAIAQLHELKASAASTLKAVRVVK